MFMDFCYYVNFFRTLSLTPGRDSCTNILAHLTFYKIFMDEVLYYVVTCSFLKMYTRYFWVLDNYYLHFLLFLEIKNERSYTLVQMVYKSWHERHFVT